MDILDNPVFNQMKLKTLKKQLEIYLFEEDYAKRYITKLNKEINDLEIKLGEKS